METRKPYIAVLIIQLIYAGMALLSKAAIDEGMNTYVFVAYRQAFATIFLAPFAFFLDRKISAPLSYSVLWKIFLVSFIGITLCLNLYYFALKYTSATLAAATTNIIPALTFTMAVISRVEKLSIKRSHGMVKVLGCLVSFCGALVFAFVKGPHIKLLDLGSTGSQEEASSRVVKFSFKCEMVKGTLVMLSANALWSMWYLMQAHVMKQYPAKVRLTTLQCLFSCVQSSVWAMAMVRDTSSWKLHWDINLLSVAYCGIVVTGITYWLQLFTVDKKGPVFVAMFTPLALVITAVVSAFLWKEKLYLGSLCGGLLLIGGLNGFLLGKNMEAKQLQQLEPKEGSTMECTIYTT
ncbi:WAT1-related protein At1g43650-like isoform X1 [Ipomoea triloba]|uniref:WAT1-related protein At1g43650-like isoform X1 n=1 Tax=Ipomoea triloba TaxID=35885 RepID=UPI00125E6D25|nr:WAT1-related protein At1g43650-like isoform X1 [Ipomoea triloba]